MIKTIIITLLLVIPYSVTNAVLPMELEYVEVKVLSIEDKIRQKLSSIDTLSDFTIELIVAQAKHESGNFKNKLTREHNNIFSRLHSKKDTLSLGSYGYAEKRTGYSVYSSIDSAVVSQLLYFKRFKYSMKWNTVEEFALELKRKRYYTDDTHNYVRAVKKHIGIK